MLTDIHTHPYSDRSESNLGLVAQRHAGQAGVELPPELQGFVYSVTQTRSLIVTCNYSVRRGDINYKSVSVFYFTQIIRLGATSQCEQTLIIILQKDCKASRHSFLLIRLQNVSTGSRDQESSLRTSPLSENRGRV